MSFYSRLQYYNESFAELRASKKVFSKGVYIELTWQDFKAMYAKYIPLIPVILIPSAGVGIGFIYPHVHVTILVFSHFICVCGGRGWSYDKVDIWTKSNWILDYIYDIIWFEYRSEFL